MEKKALNEVLAPCGCGRSPNGYCVGLHSMSEEQYQAYLEEQMREENDD
jgi:CDGSH-type Zn-finger protein